MVKGQILRDVFCDIKVTIDLEYDNDDELQNYLLGIYNLLKSKIINNKNNEIVKIRYNQEKTFLSYPPDQIGDKISDLFYCYACGEVNFHKETCTGFADLLLTKEGKEYYEKEIQKKKLNDEDYIFFKDIIQKKSKKQDFTKDFSPALKNHLSIVWNTEKFENANELYKEPDKIRKATILISVADEKLNISFKCVPYYEKKDETYYNNFVNNVLKTCQIIENDDSFSFTILNIWGYLDLNNNPEKEKIKFSPTFLNFLSDQNNQENKIIYFEHSSIIQIRTKNIDKISNDDNNLIENLKTIKKNILYKFNENIDENIDEKKTQIIKDKKDVKPNVCTNKVKKNEINAPVPFKFWNSQAPQRNRVIDHKGKQIPKSNLFEPCSIKFILPKLPYYMKKWNDKNLTEGGEQNLTEEKLTEKDIENLVKKYFKLKKQKDIIRVFLNGIDIKDDERNTRTGESRNFKGFATLTKENLIKVIKCYKQRIEEIYNDKYDIRNEFLFLKVTTTNKKNHIQIRSYDDQVIFAKQMKISPKNYKIIKDKINDDKNNFIVIKLMYNYYILNDIGKDGKPKVIISKKNPFHIVFDENNNLVHLKDFENYCDYYELFLTVKKFPYLLDEFFENNTLLNMEFDDFRYMFRNAMEYLKSISPQKK